MLASWYLRLAWALSLARFRYWFFSFSMSWLWVWEREEAVRSAGPQGSKSKAIPQEGPADLWGLTSVAEATAEELGRGQPLGRQREDRVGYNCPSSAQSGFWWQAAPSCRHTELHIEKGSLRMHAILKWSIIL